MEDTGTPLVREHRSSHVMGPFSTCLSLLFFSVAYEDASHEHSICPGQCFTQQPGLRCSSRAGSGLKAGLGTQ